MFTRELDGAEIKITPLDPMMRARPIEMKDESSAEMTEAVVITLTSRTNL